MSKVYKPLKERQKVYIKNLYLYENNNETKLAQLMTLAKLDKKVYFISFSDVEINSKEYERYLENGPQFFNDEDVSWYWTKQMLDYMDVMQNKQLKFHELDNMDDIFNYSNESDVNVFAIDEKVFKENVGFVTELFNEDYMEITFKISEIDKTQKVLPEKVKKDVEDSKNWMIQTLYDNN